jgi:hypothetical protein
MLECSSEPALCAIFSPANSAEVRNAMRLVERFVRINAELFALVEEIHEREARNADPSLDRSESLLRAA